MNTIMKRFIDKSITQLDNLVAGSSVLKVSYAILLILFTSVFSLQASDIKDALKISINAPAELEKQPTLTKVVFKNKALMRKFAISFHHALLEINYDELFAIADLSVTEKKKLDQFNITHKQATNWSVKFWNFQDSLKSKRINNKLPGITGFECYATVEETLQQGLDLSNSYPSLSEWIDIGDSWKKENQQAGYDLMVLKITNKDITENKPKLFIHSSMHAREYAPAALTLEFAHRLLEDYETNANTRWIVDYHEVHILFHMNPDGRKIAETAVLQRKNTNENHCSTGDVGVDLNRNFAYFWDYTNGSGSSGNECSQVFRGVSAESEPETQAVSNYIRSIFPDSRGPLETDAAPVSTSGMHLDIHSYSELVLWPYGHKVGASPNDSGFVALGNKLAWFNDYEPMQSVGLYATDGTSDDISYGELGIAALTFELGTSFFQDCTTYNNTIKPDNLNALYYAAKASAMPYLLAKGPEVASISLNGSENTVTVPQGTNINLVATLKTSQTKLSESGRSVSKAEYSIDAPIWSEFTTVIEIEGNDGSLSAETEAFDSIIDTSNLEMGEHILYVRGYNQNQQVGVPTAVFINIGENSSPTPEYSFNCTNLDCTYDASESNDIDGEIVSYRWDFGDGNSSSSISGSHQFSASGNKVVSLEIIDNSNNVATKTTDVTVTEAPSPTPTPEESSSSGSGALNYILWYLLTLILISLARKKHL